MLLTPILYSTIEEAFSASDWRALNYVELHDHGWIAVYAHDMLMDSKSGNMYPRDKFGLSNKDEHQLMTKPMYDWEDCIPEREVKDNFINRDIFLEIEHYGKHWFKVSEIKYIGYKDEGLYLESLVLIIDTGTIHEFRMSKEEVLDIIARHSDSMEDII